MHGRVTQDVEAPGPLDAATEGGAGLIGRSVVLCLLAAFTSLFFRRALVGGCFYAVDFHLTFQPLRTILVHSLGQGAPLWSDSLGNGGPILANPMYGALYVPNLLCTVMSPARALTLLTVLHLFVGAWGAFLLARRLGQSRAASLVAALLFSFNGAAVAATSFINLSWSLAWLPWLLVATDRTLRRGGAAAAAGLALVVGAMLILGEPFILLAGAMGAVMWLGSELLTGRREDGAPGAVRTLVRLGLGVGTGVVLALPGLLAIMTYLPESVRAAGFTSEGMTFWSFHPVLALGALLPAPFGDPGGMGLDRFWAVALVPERGAPLLAGVYVGGLALALAVLGAGVGGRRRWLLVLWAALMGLLALGRFGPIYPLLADLPVATALRFPMKWVLPAMLPVALLAARGVDAAARMAAAERSRSRALIPIVAAALVVGCVAAATAPGVDGWIRTLATARPDGAGVAPLSDARLDGIRAALQSSALAAGLPLLLAAAAIVVLAGRRRAKLITIAMLVLVAGDLLLHNPRLAPVVSSRFYREAPALVRAIRSVDDGGRVFVERPPEDVALRGGPPSLALRSRQQRELLMGHTGAAFGLNMAFDEDTEGLSPARYMRLGVLTRSAPLRERTMLAGAAGASLLVAFRPLREPWLEPVAVIPGTTEPPLRLYRDRLAVPRVRWVPTLLPYRGDEGFIAAVRTGPDDLFARVALAERSDLAGAGLTAADLAPPVPQGPVPRPDPPTVIEDRGHLLRISSTGPAGWIVVNDCYVPGWTAEIDGVRTSILPVDYAFRAVAVPEGRHEVSFRYRPW